MTHLSKCGEKPAGGTTTAAPLLHTVRLRLPLATKRRASKLAKDRHVGLSRLVALLLDECGEPPRNSS